MKKLFGIPLACWLVIAALMAAAALYFYVNYDPRFTEFAIPDFVPSMLIVEAVTLIAFCRYVAKKP